MVLPNDACSLIESDLRVILGERASHYSPSSRMQDRIVEATISKLIDHPEQLSEGDPDSIVLDLLHKVAVTLLHHTDPAFQAAGNYVEAAE